jgi:hypothetical protein
MSIGLFVIAAQLDGFMGEPMSGQVIVASPSIRSHGGTWRDVFGGERGDIFGASVLDYTEPQASGMDALFDRNAWRAR